MREGSEPAGRSLSPGKARKTPLPSSVSRSSRRDLQGPRREGAPQRIDKTGIKKIGVVTQALRQIGLTAIRCAPCLRAKLARLADDGARLGSARHRMAPRYGAFAGGTCENETVFPVEDRQKLRSRIRRELFGMFYCPNHGLGQCGKTIEDGGSVLTRNPSCGGRARQRQRKEEARIRHSILRGQREAMRSRSRLNRKRENMGRSPTAREAALPASAVKDQTAALFLEGAAAIGPRTDQILPSPRRLSSVPAPTMM